MNTALLVIDLQNDYFANGVMELKNIEETANNALKLLEYFRKSALPIVHIQHLSVRENAGFFIPNTFGAEIHPSVFPMESEKVFQKNFPNSFRQTGLKEYLEKRGIDELVICGAMSHMCIDATVRAAFDFDFSCTVAHDACTTRDLLFEDENIDAKDVHNAFMSALSTVYAKVISVNEIIKSTDKK